MASKEVSQAEVDEAVAAAQAMSLEAAEAPGAEEAEAGAAGPAEAEQQGEDDTRRVRPAVVPGAPRFEPGLPTQYDYETEYVRDGKVDDQVEKPLFVNRFTNIPAHLFRLRGPGYLGEGTTNNSKLKQPSAQAAYACVGMKVFQSSNNLTHGAQAIAPLKKFLDQLREHDEQHGKPKGDAPMYLVFTWNFANFFKTEHTAVVHVLRRTIDLDSSGSGEDPVLDRAFSRWLALSDEQKNDKLKYACIFREANPQLKGAIDMLGGERPVLIGRRLHTTYHRGEDYLEMDMDVGSSNIASMLNNILLKTSGTLVVDECLCIEGQAPDELPERALCAMRWNHCSLDDLRLTLGADGDLKLT